MLLYIHMQASALGLANEALFNESFSILRVKTLILLIVKIKLDAAEQVHDLFCFIKNSCHLKRINVIKVGYLVPRAVKERITLFRKNSVVSSNPLFKRNSDSAARS